MFPADVRILVIDDFKTMRSIVKKTLQNMGYSSIDEAEDGAQGYQRMTQAFTEGKPFGLVVCDWNMPNMNGLELTKAIRNDATFGTLPVLMVTTRGIKEDIVQALQAKVNNYIVKPFTPAVLKEKIQAIVPNA